MAVRLALHQIHDPASSIPSLTYNRPDHISCLPPKMKQQPTDSEGKMDRNSSGGEEKDGRRRDHGRALGMKTQEAERLPAVDSGPREGPNNS